MLGAIDQARNADHDEAHDKSHAGSARSDAATVI